jgi:hypothetical protein
MLSLWIAATAPPQVSDTTHSIKTLAVLALATAVVVLVTALIGLAGTFRNGRKIANIEVKVDGRLDEALNRIHQLEDVIETSDKDIPPFTEKTGHIRTPLTSEEPS